MNENMFEITFADGKMMNTEAFNASQAEILASADRIRAGGSPNGFEHIVVKIRKPWPRPIRQWVLDSIKDHAKTKDSALP
jgi:hypothetical protein